MKLYMHPASTVSRPVMTFLADHAIACEQQIVDVMTGEHRKPAFAAINPNCQIPVLEDGDFRLTESSAILKYLADKVGSPAYPTALQARARVNEAMDWLNTGFYRVFGYGLCYPQLLDDAKLSDPAGRKQALDMALAGTDRYLRVLDGHMLGGRRPYLCGESPTLADYLGSGMISLGEVIGCTYAAYPQVRAWYERLKARPNWQSANAGVYGWAQFARGPDYVRV